MTQATSLVYDPESYLTFETDDNLPLTWCEGCGNFKIENALRQALAYKKIERDGVIFCYDVGCSGNGSDKMEGFTIHGLHGRVLPLAAGVKIGNPQVHVVAEAGDGATFSEGINHLIHAVRNDYPILFLLHNNQNYALTTGQPSSLTPRGRCMNAAPEGVSVDPLNPFRLALGLEPSFFARTLSADLRHLTDTILQGLEHSGFAFIEILQTCPTYFKENSDSWYLSHTKKVEEAFEDYDPTSKSHQQKILEDSENLYLGVLAKNPGKIPFEV